MILNAKIKEQTMYQVDDYIRPVIVTTEHRGVFFGYAKNTSEKTIKLRACRLCLFWSKDVKGFMGLAVTGPSSACRIGPAANAMIHNVTCVLEVSPQAVVAWETAPWSIE